jgi:hypothetical protein
MTTRSGAKSSNVYNNIDSIGSEISLSPSIATERSIVEDTNQTGGNFLNFLFGGVKNRDIGKTITLSKLLTQFLIEAIDEQNFDAASFLLKHSFVPDMNVKNDNDQNLLDLLLINQRKIPYADIMIKQIKSENRLSDITQIKRKKSNGASIVDQPKKSPQNTGIFEKHTDLHSNTNNQMIFDEIQKFFTYNPVSTELAGTVDDAGSENTSSPVEIKIRPIGNDVYHIGRQVQSRGNDESHIGYQAKPRVSPKYDAFQMEKQVSPKYDAFQMEKQVSPKYDALQMEKQVSPKENNGLPAEFRTFLKENNGLSAEFRTLMKENSVYPIEFRKPMKGDDIFYAEDEETPSPDDDSQPVKKESSPKETELITELKKLLSSNNNNGSTLSKDANHNIQHAPSATEPDKALITALAERLGRLDRLDSSNKTGGGGGAKQVVQSKKANQATVSPKIIASVSGTRKVLRFSELSDYDDNSIGSEQNSIFNMSGGTSDDEMNRISQAIKAQTRKLHSQAVDKIMTLMHPKSKNESMSLMRTKSKNNNESMTASAVKAVMYNEIKNGHPEMQTLDRVGELLKRINKKSIESTLAKNKKEISKIVTYLKHKKNKNSMKRTKVQNKPRFEESIESVSSVMSDI